ncbi:ATP-binding protein [Amycolatopsis speibonae]|uniref:AAA family ATPase n=1 Tax=Amycolatopsis speibonae TaxID=1450224 RepID=A0ABV7P4C9_9PSEU
MEDIIDAVQAGGPPLVLLTGLRGAGRTSTLASLSDKYEAAGRHVSAMRFTARGDVLPTRFTLDGNGRDHISTTQLRGPMRGEPVWAPIGPVANAADEPAVAARAAHAAAMALQRTGEGIVLLDDLQWIDRNSLAVLERLLRIIDGMQVTCVGALRVPAGGDAARYGPESLARLREENLVRTLRVKPMGKEEVAERLAATLLATPEPALITRVHDLSRGVHATVSEATDLLLRRGAIKVVDRSAYLVPGTAEAEPFPQSEYAKRVRALGRAVWEAAKAAAILFPLGPAMPRLIGQAIGTDERETLDLLEVLRRAGVLHRGRKGGSWRFTVPLSAISLADSVGPCERRELAAIAVDALWAGTATCTDPDLRGNLLADAGRLIDPVRATEELLTQATAVRDTYPESTLRWLKATTELTDDRTQRAKSLLMLASGYHRYGDHRQALHCTRLLLDEYMDQLNPDSLIESQSLLIHGLNELGETEALMEIANGDHRLSGTPGSRTVIRALASAVLDRWADAEQHLAAESSLPGEPCRTVLARLIKTTGALWQGRPELFEQSLRERESWPARDIPRYRMEQVDNHLTGLLMTGELSRAEELLAAEDLSWENTRPCVQVLSTALRGEFRIATELACRIVAEQSSTSFDAATAGMYHAAVSGLVCQGRLATARALLTAARATTPVLAHLLDFTEAQIDRALGDDRRAADRFTAALATAGERGLVVGSDLACAELADLSLGLGDRETAERCQATAERLAATLATGRAILQAEFVRGVVSGNRNAAARSLRLAYERDQPLELALTIVRLVKHRVASPPLLAEAYELLGYLGALLLRAQTRSLMREHGIAVPGRRKTVEENEHLLAVLAAEGLSNKQIAAVLSASERSVEGRLSRLFSRTGYCSRIELSTAMVNGSLRF